MTDKQTKPTANLDAASVEFLNKECERMMTLYSQAQANIQNVFNFYLTFVSGVLGATVVLIELTDDTAAWAVGLVLFFAVIVGTVYLSAISGRYAHAARFAEGVDAIRRYLIEQQNISLPPIYESFVDYHPRAMEGRRAWVYWLIPTGTYQMFIAVVNSAAVGAGVWLIYAFADAGAGRTVLAGIVAFLATLTIYNMYSRLVISRFSTGLHVHVWRDSPAWASRD